MELRLHISNGHGVGAVAGGSSLMNSWLFAIGLLGEAVGFAVVFGFHLLCSAAGSEFRFHPVSTWPKLQQGICLEVLVRDNRAYVPVSKDAPSGCLNIVDVSNPALPVPLGSVCVKPAIKSMGLVGEHAYLFAGDYWYEPRLFIADVSNPLAPVVVRTNATLTGASAFVVTGRYGFMAGPGAVLRVLDVRDPLDPVLLAGAGTGGPGQAVGLAVDGNYAFVITDEIPPGGPGGIGRMAIVDIRNPTNPQLQSVHTTSLLRAIAVRHPYAFLSRTGDILEVVSIADPSSPSRVLSYPGLNAERLLAVDNLLFAACVSYGSTAGFVGLRILDIGDIANVSEVSRWPTSDARDLVLSGDQVYLAAYGSVEIVDVAIPSAPQHTGSLATRSYPAAIDVSAGHAYVGEGGGGGGVKILDIARPSAPHLVGQFEVSQSISDVRVIGSRAFVAAGKDGLLILDVRDPTRPTLLGGFATDAVGLAVAGPYAYVVRWSLSADVGGLEILDVSDPANPSLVGKFSEPGCRDVVVSGDHAYVARDHGVVVVNVRDRTKPERLGEVETGAGVSVLHIAALDSHLYLACGRSGLRIVNVADPRSPEMFTPTWNTTGIQSVEIAEGFAFVAAKDGMARVFALDLSDPAKPAAIGLYANSSWTETGPLKIADHFAYVCLGQAELSILGLDPPGLPAPATLAMEHASAAARLEMRGQPGRTHVLQTASGLSAEAFWQDVETNRSADGMLRLELPAHVVTTNRLFRALSD